jgi:uncharacterized membrane protein
MRGISVKVIKPVAIFIFVCSLSFTRGNSHITNAPAIAPAIAVSGIHIAGYDGTDAVYWRNGERFVLPKSGKYADAYAMAIAGSDVYIVGKDTRETADGNLRDDAVYWRNGERFELPKRGEEACAWGIAVNGSDIYIVGSDTPKAFGERDAVYWLNGERFILPKKSKGSTAYSIAINGPDVYITGTDGYSPVYWLNGERFELPKAGPSFLATYTTAIAVNGSDVYIAGHQSNHTDPDKIEENAMYWHNGKLFALPKLGRTASTSAIAIAGSDVYITGSDLYSRGEGAVYDAVYWLNGERFVLPKRGGRAGAKAIAVVGPDVYIAGFDEDGPVYWRNGELVPIKGVDLPHAIAVTQ